MSTRTRILAWILFLAALGGIIAVDAASDTAASIIFGVLAGVTLWRWAGALAAAFTKPPAHRITSPR